MGRNRLSPSVIVPQLPEDTREELQKKLTERKVGDGVILISNLSKEEARRIVEILKLVPSEHLPSVERQINDESEMCKLARLQLLEENMRKEAEYKISKRKPWEQALSNTETSVTTSDNSPKDVSGNLGNPIDAASQTRTLGGLHNYAFTYFSSEDCPVNREERDVVLESILKLIDDAFPNNNGEETKVEKRMAQYWIGRIATIASKHASQGAWQKE